MAFPKFQTKEVLNKVLNSGEDALNVDLSTATVTVDSEFPAAAALQDDSGNPTTTSVGSHLLGYDSGNTNWNRVEVDDAGHLQIDVLSITAGDNNIGNVDIASALPSGSNTIGKVDLGTTDNAVLDAIDAVLDTIKIDTEAIETAVEAVNQAAEGTITSTTQRVTIATDDDGVAHLATIAGAVSTQMQVDVVAISAQSDGTYIGDIKFGESLPAGTNNIGDVDVLSIVPGYGATNLGKREDDAHSNLDTGVMALVVRNDVLEALAGTDGDYSALQVNKTGALNVTETVGHLGAYYENGTSTVDSLKIVAFQFLEDTKFSVLTPATSAYIGNTSSGGEDVPNDEVFPQGMTIFGRWTAFTLVSGGRVIAYLGDW